MAHTLYQYRTRLLFLAVALGTAGGGWGYYMLRRTTKGSVVAPVTKLPWKIVATTGMIADAVRQVGGDRVCVRALMGPGVDPHAYRCAPKDMAHMRNADAIFYNGLRLEGQMQGFLENLAAQHKTVYAVGQAIPANDLLRDPNFSTGIDPHIWHDPLLWQHVVKAIQQQLTRLDAAGSSYYLQRAKAYCTVLQQLHQDLERQLNVVPAKQRVLVTAHDAFGYFGRRYRIAVRALQGISTVAEYGLQDVAALTQFIVQRKISAIFVETSVPDRPIRALLAGCARRGHAVQLGGPLFSDAMGEENTAEGTYVGMLQANTRTIAAALTRKAKASRAAA